MRSHTSQEIVARNVSQFFPASQLRIQGNGGNETYEIVLNDSILIRIDYIGATFNFPTRSSGQISWSGIKEGTPEAVASGIIRDLADAGFTVFSPSGKKIMKRPVFVGRHTFCPQSNEMGTIRKIVYGLFPENLDTERYIFCGAGVGFNDPEVKCIGCGWSGSLEDVRFTKRRNN